MSEPSDASSPGWEAINRALRPLYGDREPKHYGTLIKWTLGGPDPLDGISAYKRTDHWHFVSYGLTELHDKESEDREVSGYGFELTFRLRCRPEDPDPPAWALNFLQNLARYVFQTGNVFAAGHHMTLNGPIALDQKTDITAVLFVDDPELPAIDSSNGRLSFVQIVGITDDELHAVQAWDTLRFAESLKATTPLLLTDLERPSLLADPKTAAAIAEATERDGSSMAELLVSTAHWTRKGLLSKRTRLTMNTLAVTGFIRQLRGRLLHGRKLLVVGQGGKPENVAAFEPGEKPSIAVAADGGYLVVSLPATIAREMLEKLRPKTGVYEWPSFDGFEIEVVPTEITDRDGKVIRVER